MKTDFKRNSVGLAQEPMTGSCEHGGQLTVSTEDKKGLEVHCRLGCNAV